MSSSGSNSRASEGDVWETKLDCLEADKDVANQLYKSQCYSEAAEAYVRVAADLLDVDIDAGNVTQLVEAVKASSITDQRGLNLLATLLCNTALSCFNLNKIDDTETLCEACLQVDAYNYKAAYYLVQCAMKRKNYAVALKYVDRCQGIVDEKKLDKNKAHPHVELMKTIRAKMESTEGGYNCDAIISNVQAGEAVGRNLDNIKDRTDSEILQQQVYPRLMRIIKEKPDYIEYLDLHSGFWMSLSGRFRKLKDKSVSELGKQIETALDEIPLDIVSYVNDVMDGVSRNPQATKELVKISMEVANCCAYLKSFVALEALTNVVCKHGNLMDVALIRNVYQYLTTMNIAEKQVLDGRSADVLGRLMDGLVKSSALKCEKEIMEKIEVCLSILFLKGFGKFEVNEDTFTALVTNMLNLYCPTRGLDIAAVAYISEPFYTALKCLYPANRDMFKAYVISSDLMTPLSSSFIPSAIGVTDGLKKKLMTCEIMALCMDFVECRKQLLDATVNGVSVLESLKKDEGFNKYLQEIKTRDRELKEYCKNASPKMHDVVVEDVQTDIYEYNLLILSKLTVHSDCVKKQILKLFDLFFLVPRAMIMAIKDRNSPGTMVDAMSYITLHEEAKHVDFPQFVCAQLIWVNSGFHSKATTMYMTCQTITNILRCREDRCGYNRKLGKNAMWDENQMELLRKAFEKLPDDAKPPSNGEYNEGNAIKATVMREYIVKHHQDIPGTLIKIASWIVGDKNKWERRDGLCNALDLKPNTNAYMLILEAFHYLALPMKNRPWLQSAGLLHVLTDAVNRDACRGTNQCRYLTQSIAHMCITTNPKVLTYRDALDAVGPLVKLLDDSNELFQYEAALGLTNLLSIGDDVRKRMWSANGWHALGNLLSSENPQLKAACLEGWCNLTAGEDVVHGHFYTQLSQQMEKAEDPSKLITLNVHDINILLLFAADTSDMRCVMASTGALALLTQDLRISKYFPFIPRIRNLFSIMDSLNDPEVVQRVLTILSSILEGQLDDLSPVNERHVRKIKQQIQDCVRRNLPKYDADVIIALAKEVINYQFE